MEKNHKVPDSVPKNNIYQKNREATSSHLLVNLDKKEKLQEIFCIREGVGLDTNTENTSLNAAEQIFGPDEYTNYIITNGEIYDLLDKYGEKLNQEKFDYILPYQNGLYIARIENHIFYIDAFSGELFFLDGNEYDWKLKINQGEEKVLYNEKLDIVKESITPLYPDTHTEVLKKVFKNLLYQYEVDLLAKDSDKIFVNSKKISDNYQKLLYALYGTYHYLFSGKITPSLAGKSSELRDDLFQFPFLKERLPDIYLAMHELQNIKEVLVNIDGEVLGYIEKKGDKYGYKTPDGKRIKNVEFEDFRGPDAHGNIIIRNGGKEYFINEDFSEKDLGFDKIENADIGGNYVAFLNEEKCLIKKDASFFKISNFSTGDNNSSPANMFEEIQPLDKNENYIITHQTGSFLVDKETNIISDRYLHIDPLDQNNLYVAVDIQGSILLNNKGKEILPHMHDKIHPLKDGNYKLLFKEKYGLFLVENQNYIPCNYDTIESSGNGIFKVSNEEKWGRLNNTGQEIIPLGEYDLMDPVDKNDLHKVSKVINENLSIKVLHGMIDKKGKKVIPCEFNQIILNSDGNYTAKKSELEMNYTKEGIYFTYDHIEDKNSLKKIWLQLLRSKRWLYVDEADTNGLFKVSIQDKYDNIYHGLVKDINTEIIPCEYDKISLREDGKYVASFPEKEHIFDHEGIMRECEFGDESKKREQELNQLYRDIIDSGKRDYVENVDGNGLFKVLKIIGGKMYYGLVKDINTEIISCECDKIFQDSKNTAIYTIEKNGEVLEIDININNIQ